MLVDHRRDRRAASKPDHEVRERVACGRREGASGVPQIMETQVRPAAARAGYQTR
jgi:hypothetical protein